MGRGGSDGGEGWSTAPLHWHTGCSWEVESGQTYFMKDGAGGE